MPAFTCTVCGKSFDIPKPTLARYPKWEPKYCRVCSPRKGRATERQHEHERQRSEGHTSPSLTLAEVLTRHHTGPSSGIFTDGACAPNPGPGGWGAVWVEQGEVRERAYGKEPETTNNRMELTAIIAGMEMVPKDAGITLFTDSRLCVDTLEKWATGWRRRGWTRPSGPISNLDLVQRAYGLRTDRPKLRIEWIAAHQGHRWNEYADSLATAWMREIL